MKQNEHTTHNFVSKEIQPLKKNRRRRKQNKKKINSQIRFISFHKFNSFLIIAATDFKELKHIPRIYLLILNILHITILSLPPFSLILTLYITYTGTVCVFIDLVQQKLFVEHSVFKLDSVY